MPAKPGEPRLSTGLVVVELESVVVRLIMNFVKKYYFRASRLQRCDGLATKTVGFNPIPCGQEI
jgi:hypothetical protein